MHNQNNEGVSGTTTPQCSSASRSISGDRRASLDPSPDRR